MRKLSSRKKTKKRRLKSILNDKSILTCEVLKENLHYDTHTGIFTWVKKKSRVRVGKRAGYITKKGYRSVEINGKAYPCHRLAWLYMTGKFPEKQVDHINHIKDDNRWCNLREVTNQENQMNTPIRLDNTSGVTGVYWKKENSKWSACIRFDGKLNHLGYFLLKEDAIASRKEAEIKYGFHENHGKVHYVE